MLSNLTKISRCNISRVAIIGGGQMGSGIAQLAASVGQQVTIIDLDASALKNAEKYIRNGLDLSLKWKIKDDQKRRRNVDQVLFNISYSTEIFKAADSHLVIETVVENIHIKKKIFADLDIVTLKDTIFASNTSSLPITDIANATQRPDRCGGLHFFNPVHLMKLVEVVKTAETSLETYNKLNNWAKSLGKTTVECMDTPGFLVNRLLVSYLLEAVRLHERGHGTKEDIDVAMKLGAGYPMGPFQLLDYVGLDTCKFIIDGWSRLDLKNPLFQPSPMLNELVEEGKLGIKTGIGFYDYQKPQK